MLIDSIHIATHHASQHAVMFTAADGPIAELISSVRVSTIMYDTDTYSNTDINTDTDTSTHIYRCFHIYTYIKRTISS